MIMSARRIVLSNGVELSTPLLIPSFSSRAVGPMLYEPSPANEPVLTPCSIVHSELLIHSIDESLLVSAYDIHHELLVDSESFKDDFRHSRYAQPRLLFIDSGWYEKSGSSLDKQFGENQYGPLQWTESEYKCTINHLDDDIRPIVVNWDHFGSYSEQIAAGQDFFGGRPCIASTLLLKPPSNARIHDFRKFSGEDFANLRAFDIIGVTEQEIGESVIDRLVNIANLRRHLNESGIKSPIHIFGGLDPLFTPLYFAAGGELFDGLGWLRYTYRDGVAMHRDTAAIIDRQIARRRIPRLLSACIQNLDELRRLSEDLRLLARDKYNWTHLFRGELLEPIFRALEGRLGD